MLNRTSFQKISWNNHNKLPYFHITSNLAQIIDLIDTQHYASMSFTHTIPPYHGFGRAERFWMKPLLHSTTLFALKIHKVVNNLCKNDDIYVLKTTNIQIFDIIILIKYLSMLPTFDGISLQHRLTPIPIDIQIKNTFLE